MALQAQQPQTSSKWCFRSFFIIFESRSITKHLLTALSGNGEFCFPKILNVPQGETEGNIETKKQNSLFPEGAVIKYLLITLL